TRSVNRARALDDVALDEIDAERASRLERRAILDLLGDDTEIERARQLDHRADHLAVHAVLGKIARVDAVDLQVVEGQILQVRERADAAAEVFERETTADAVQHGDESPSMIEVVHDGGLAHLEADLRGIDAGVVEQVDDELEKAVVAERLPREIDVARSVVGHVQRAAGHRAQRALHDPTIDMGHQLVTLGGAEELRREHGLARLVAHPQQHLDRRAVHAASRDGDDRLRMQLEPSFLQRALQPLQPLDLASFAREDLVASRVDVHASAALLLRDVASRIRGAQDRLGRDALVPDLDHADADADVEDAVLPREAIIRHRLADVAGDLTRLVERTADEQHRELVSADARDGIRIANFLLEQRRDLSQQIVAGDVSAGVVDELEIIEVEIADDVPHRVGASRCERRLEPPLELRTVHEPGQRVVSRLIRHLASET